MTGLTEEQQRTFWKQGFLLLERVLKSEDLAPVIAEFEKVVGANARRLRAEGKISDTFAECGFDTRLARISAESPEAFNALFSGVHSGRALFELMRHPVLLAIAESLVGPEIACHPAYRVRPKLPDHERTVVPWHQDAGYMAPECDGFLQLTVWIPLVDATVENGCMEAIPGVHQNGILRHVKGPYYLDIPPDVLPTIPPVSLPVPFGGAVLLTNLTPHRSTPNYSDRVRWSVDIRYQDARLPSGYPPEAGFTVQSRADPAQAVTTWEVFHHLRTNHVPGPGPDRWREEC